jgi:hypothetical protein
MVKSKYKGEGTQGLKVSTAKTREGDLFTTREIGDVLPALLGRHDAEQDPLGERIETVDEFQFSVSTHRDHLPSAFNRIGVFVPDTSP